MAQEELDPGSGSDGRVTHANGTPDLDIPAVDVGGSTDMPNESTDVPEAQPSEPEVSTREEVSAPDSNAIRWIQRDYKEPSKEEDWQDPRKSENECLPHWLRVCRVKGSEIPRTYIHHTGKSTWQKDEVKLKSRFTTIVLNFAKLKSAARNGPSDETSRRLEEFLSVVASLVEPRLLESLPTDQDLRDVRVEYRHLWTMFRPGNLIVSNKHGGEFPQVFKIDRFRFRKDIFTVTAWMWDWNGQGLTQSMYDFHITSYNNENTSKALVDLECYPIEFYEGEDGTMGAEALKTLLSSKRRGVFLQYTAEQGLNNNNALSYFGIAFGDAPAFPSDFSPEATSCQACRNENGSNERSRPESKLITLDEDIVLDSKTYLRRVGHGRLLGILEPLQETQENLCKCRLCMSPLTEQWLGKISAVFKARADGFDAAMKAAMEFPPTDDDLLLPPRVFGFALLRKQWCQFSLDHKILKPIVEVSGDGNIPGLVLPSKLGKSQRKDIYKLVSSHKRLMGREKQERLADTISSKGDSLLLLFHGHSGTGKTLYAESLAASCRLPLFRVGTSDLGLEAAHAERRLKEIFELAAAWSAVLLIDEADVLLDARGKENESLVSKNALVSVLLREVEYFRGILIMTTNRVRAFDPAILSRIQHAVDFEETTSEQELSLWYKWYERLRAQGLCDGEKQIWEWMEQTNKRKKRNFLCGREIRNVIFMAQSFAEQEGSNRIRIKREHLETAYDYKLDFLQETEDKMRQAKAMVIGGARAEGF